MKFDNSITIESTPWEDDEHNGDSYIIRSKHPILNSQIAAMVLSHLPIRFVRHEGDSYVYYLTKDPNLEVDVMSADMARKARFWELLMEDWENEPDRLDFYGLINYMTAYSGEKYDEVYDNAIKNSAYGGIKEETRDKERQAQIGLQFGAVSVNEYREILGLPKLPGGDVCMISKT